MKQILLFLLTILAISCSSKYVQVYETKPTSDMKTENDIYTFEDESVKIAYSFWANRGILSYTVFNKLNVPIYIDWKKSSYVKNTNKLDYWIDASTTKSISRSRTSIAYGNIYGASFNTSTTIKPEQIVFIAPKSTITKDQFILWTEPKANLNNANTETRNTGNKKIAKVKYIKYTQQNSPLVFRNFLTISTSDKFDKETYIDNGFFISKISQMDKDNFYGKKTQVKMSYIYEMPYKRGNNFYIDAK